MRDSDSAPRSGCQRPDREQLTLRCRSAMWRGIPAVILAVAALSAGCSDADDPTPDATVSTTPGATTNAAGGQNDLVPDGSGTPDDVAGEAPLETLAPQDSDDGANDPEDDVTAPGFSPPDSVLAEDAFDGPDLVLESVDLAAGDDGPAVTLQVRGTGFPGWEAQYVDPEASPLAGTGPKAVLAIELMGVNASQAEDTLLEPSGSVTDLVVGEVDGERLAVYLGLSHGPMPFRVHLQYTPLRLVVDVYSE